jgi:hypothetical protein
MAGHKNDHVLPLGSLCDICLGKAYGPYIAGKKTLQTKDINQTNGVLSVMVF